jgi:cytochrome c oxidase cbb3-type subunit III
MANEQDPRLMDHSYDGIQEYDNPLPRWWVITFWATIVFSVLYVLNVPPFGRGEGRLADYEADMAAWRTAHPAPSVESSPEELAALATDDAAITLGRTVYSTHCASCHRPDGGGLIGPNLTDDFWIHGGALVDVHRTVAEGVLAKGMPAWSKILAPDQIDVVVAYVASLRGSNPPKAKLAEGTPYTP